MAVQQLGVTMNGPSLNGKLGWVTTTLATLLLSICGAILSHFQSRVRDVEMMIHHDRERITALESHLQDMTHQLQRIEDKLDRVRRLP